MYKIDDRRADFYYWADRARQELDGVCASAWSAADMACHMVDGKQPSSARERATLRRLAVDYALKALTFCQGEDRKDARDALHSAIRRFII